MSDTRALVLTIVGSAVGLAVLLTGVMFALIGGVNTRIDDVNTNLTAQITGVNTRIDDLRGELKAEIAVLRDDVRGMDARLRAVENALGKVDQRLLTIERVVLPGPDADE